MAYLGEDIKKLGFGLMRLPKNGDVIDVEQTKKMVDMFLVAGFTYFDTAWAYPAAKTYPPGAGRTLPARKISACNQKRRLD